jgi:putative phosphoribosyl transferase
MPAPVDRGVAVGLHRLELAGHLTVPRGARGVVLLVADPAGNALLAPERLLAQRLAGAGIGTLGVDLIAAEERARASGPVEIDPDLFAVRVLAITRWLRSHPDTRDRSIGYFGTSAGAGVAMLAAAEDPTVGALVARDGVLDLASSRLSAVRAPTLLLVDEDGERVASNQDAVRHLRCEHALAVVPPRSDDAAHRQSVDWFARHLPAAAPVAPPLARGGEER